MDIENLIRADVFCNSHKVEITFIYSLREYGLIEITEQNEDVYLHPEQLENIERYLRLYSDLDINIEGIEAIAGLLSRMNEMQSEIRILKNKLKKYENI